MNPNSDKELSKSALKKIVLCAFMMSGIDGYIDDDEVEVIQEFTDKYWRKDFGDPDEFYLEIDKEIGDFMIPSEGKFDLNIEFVKKILNELDFEDEELLLDLMTDVMEADGIIDPSEKKLIKMIKNHIAGRE